VNILIRAIGWMVDINRQAETYFMSLYSYMYLSTVYTRCVYEIHRGYSILFDEIYYTSETGFLIFSRVPSTSENIINILSHKWNKFHIYSSTKHWIFGLLHFLCFLNMFVSNLQGFRAVTQHNVIIKTRRQNHFCYYHFCYFHCENNSVKI
jgi:hypothetical protein